MYICGEQFKNICDFYFYYDDLYAKNDHIIYHNLNNNKNKTEIKGHSFNPNRTNQNISLQQHNIDINCIFDNCLIFMNFSFVGTFIVSILPKINKNINIIIHNTDLSIGKNISELLNNKYINTVWSQNIDLKHKKLFPIPIGIANHRIRRTGIYVPHSDVNIIKKVENMDIKKNNKIYVDFHLHIDKHNHRKSCLEEIGYLDNYIFKNDNRQDFLENCKTVKSCKYILSPHGNGLDCHRTWESLIFKTIPIVKTSTLDDLYKDLPVIIVNQWNDIDFEKLLTFKTEDFKDICTIEYWRKKIYKKINREL